MFVACQSIDWQHERKVQEPYLITYRGLLCNQKVVRRWDTTKGEGNVFVYGCSTLGITCRVVLAYDFLGSRKENLRFSAR